MVMPSPVCETRTLIIELRGAPLEVSCLYRPGDFETLLYFHGLGSTKEDFRDAWQVPEWFDFTLLAFDAPGAGETRGYRHGVPLGVDDIVTVAECLVDQLGLGDLTIIGHSLGGLAGLLFSVRHTALVRRFVSVEGNLGAEDCSIYSRRVFQECFLGSEKSFMTAFVNDIRRSELTGFDQAADTIMSNVEPHAFFDYCRSIVEYSDRTPLREDFVHLHSDKLYVHGSENRHLSHPAYLSARGVPVAEIPNSNHFPLWSNPEAFYRALVNFVDGTGQKHSEIKPV